MIGGAHFTSSSLCQHLTPFPFGIATTPPASVSFLSQPTARAHLASHRRIIDS